MFQSFEIKEKKMHSFPFSKKNLFLASLHLFADCRVVLLSGPIIVFHCFPPCLLFIDCRQPMAIYYPLAFEDDKNRKIESEENLWDNKNRLIINWDFLPWKINMYGRSIELIESTFWSQQIGCIRNLGPTCDTSFWHVDIRAGITVQAPLKLANSSFFMFLTILWTLILTIWGSCGDLNRLSVWGIQRTG